MLPRIIQQDAESAGAQYATDQLQSDYFMDWVRDQMLEASKADPSEMLPLETKADAMVIAKNMLKQLAWDTQREHHESKEFYEGFRKTLDASREWLADELLTIKGEMGGGDVEARRGRTSERHRSPPITRVVISKVRNGWIMKAYDSDGHLRSGITAPTDLEYVKRKAEEWFPGVPVEQSEPGMRSPKARGSVRHAR